MTDAAVLYRRVLADPADRTLRAAFLDAAMDEGVSEAEALAAAEAELAAAGLSCEMWMYWCGECSSTLEELAVQGCGPCRRWAALSLRKTELWHRIRDRYDAR